MVRPRHWRTQIGFRGLDIGVPARCQPGDQRQMAQPSARFHHPHVQHPRFKHQRGPRASAMTSRQAGDSRDWFSARRRIASPPPSGTPRQ